MKTNLIKNAAAAALSLAMILSMSACGHQHTWTDATCTAPKTCAECGNTEGEALGHNWQDATCAAPKTCSTCKETEGEALPHDMAEANFQAPATCTVCGATEGEVLTPEFEKYPVELTPLEGEHDIIFMASDDNETSGVCKISLADYQRFDSDDTHPAKEGYEYLTAVIDIIVCEGTPSFSFRSGGNDYYSATTVNFKEADGKSEGDPDVSGTVSIYGEKYEFWTKMTTKFGEWEKDPETDKWVLHITINLIAQEPVGYDGIVACVYDSAIVTDDVLNADGKYFPAEVLSKNPGHYAAFRLA